MDNLRPDMYFKDIYSVNYEKLLNMGIKCIIFDLDNTIAPLSQKEPTKAQKDFFNHLELMGFRCIIMSNAEKERVRPFKEGLNLDSSFSSRKPRQKKFKKILKEYHLYDDTTAIIGDQIFTDILGGNLEGILTILVDPLSKKDRLGTKFLRILERIVFLIFKNKGLFKKGEYYE